MGWNGSNNGSGAVVKDQGRKPSAKAAPSFKKGIIAGLVVVIGAGLAAWWIGRPGTSAPTTNKKAATKQIAEVTPQIVTQAVEEVSVEKTSAAKSAKQKELPPQKVGEVRDGYRLLGNGKLHKVNGVVTTDLSHRKSSSSIFKHRSENIIAGLLTAKPGDVMVGRPNYNGTFTKDFFDSLQDPIIINPDDSDRDKELKESVIEAKKELKAAMDRGEDVEKIIMDARKEAQDLARYKQLLQQDLVVQLKSDEVTDEDVDLYIEAANKMLEAKGIAPISAGPITRLRLKMNEGVKE